MSDCTAKIKIQFEEIKIRKRILLHKNCLEIVDGGVTLMKGSNGVGKTLLLHNMFCQQDGAGVLISQNNDEIIEEIGILENIAMFHLEYDENYILEMLEKISFSHILERDVKTLSGGEKRIISLLRGVLSSKKMIFIDEPTNDLDYRLVACVLEIIKYFSGEKTFVIVTHDRRLDILADDIYIIKDQTIVHEFTGNTSVVQGRQEKKADIVFNVEKTKILKKLFPKQYYKVILYIFLIVVSVYYMFDIQKTFCNQVKDMPKKQVDIYSTLSILSGQSALNGALPIKMFEFCNQKSSLYEKIKSLKNAKKYVSEASITFGLDLNATSHYSIYDLEYYCVGTKTHYCIQDLYGKNKSKENSKEEKKISFDNVEDDNGNNILFEVDKLEKTCENWKLKQQEAGKECTVLYRSLLLKDNYTFYDLIKEEQFQELLDGNFYIRSHETIKLTNEIYAFENLKKCLEQLGICYIIILSFNFFYIYFYRKVKEKNILILKNYGVECEEICSFIQKSFDDKKLVLFILLALSLCNTMILSREDRYILVGSYGIVLLDAFVLFIGDRCRKLMIHTRLHKIYKWWYR